MNEKQPSTARCEPHGLAYDPELHDGCVLCRKEKAEAEPEAEPTPRSGRVALIAGALAVLALGGVSAGVYTQLSRRQAAIEADGPEEPEVSPVVSALPGVSGHKGTVMLGRKGTDDYGYPKDLPDKLTLQGLLREKRFDELSSYIESFQTAVEEDFRNEKWLSVAMGTFATADRQIGKRINQWVKATPDSFAPHLARANHRIALAWHYRGNSWARLTSSKRLAKMRKILVPALSDVDLALERHPSSTEARSTKLWILNGLGADVATKTETLEAGLRHCPYCFGIRAAYLGTVEPRWGGSHRLMERKAADWQFTKRNPKLQQLLGFTDADRCELAAIEEPEEALLSCDRALSEGRNAGFLGAKASALIELERYDDAIALFDEALDILPQSVRLLNRRGIALMKKESYDEAARDFVLVTRLDPVHSQAATNLYHILGKMVRVAYYQAEAGELDAAIAAYDRALIMHPRYADALSYRGSAYVKKGDLERAEKDFRKAIGVDPTHLHAHRGLDHVLVQRERLDEIVRLWNRYLKRKPKDAVALFERSGTHHRKGNHELARRDVTAACRLGNKDACDIVQRYYSAR